MFATFEITRSLSKNLSTEARYKWVEEYFWKSCSKNYFYSKDTAERSSETVWIIDADRGMNFSSILIDSPPFLSSPHSLAFHVLIIKIDLPKRRSRYYINHAHWLWKIKHTELKRREFRRSSVTLRHASVPCIFQRREYAIREFSWK